MVGVYGFVWGGSQLWSGPLSDRVGRKWPIVIGMWTCAAGIVLFVMAQDSVSWSLAAAVMGVGMALLYPTLIAAIGDISHPQWRGTSLGVYRLWCDFGYGIGGLLIGLSAQFGGSILTGFWVTVVAMAVSGLWVAVAMEETLERFAG